jgi:Skp family chaperone for outer membrane proteins
MDPSVFIVVGVVALVVLPFILAVLTFRPLIISIADRIGGRKSGAKELKDLKQKISLLQDELADLRHKVTNMEDDYQFSQKMLEDLEKRSKEPSAD